MIGRAAESVVRSIASAALVLLSAPPASALDKPETSAEATRLFEEGVAAMDQGRYAEACPKLFQSQQLAPSGGTLLNLAKCYEQNGQTASAWLRYEEAAERAEAAGKPDMVRLARAASRKLKPKVSTIVVSTREREPSLEIRHNGELLPSTELGTAMPVDPGDHVFEAVAAGKQSWRTTVRVPVQKAILQIEIPPLHPIPPPRRSAPPPPPAKVAPASADTDNGSQRAIGVVIGAAGIVGLGIGTYFGLSAKSKNDEASEHCRAENLCTARGLELDDEARDAATASTIAFIAGGALLTAGVVLFVTAPDGSRREISLRAEPAARGNGAQFKLGTSF
jgi:serine/threonine-protein kinase